MKKAFGESDAGFREKFDGAIRNMRASETHRHTMRLRMVPVLAAVLACLLVSTVVYAVVSNYVDRVDTGANWELVTTPDPTKKYNLMDNYFKAPHISSSWFNGVSCYSLYWVDYPFERDIKFIDAETAKVLSAQAEGYIFTEDGEPFDPFFPMPNMENMYWVSDMGHKLYDDPRARGSSQIVQICYTFADIDAEREPIIFWRTIDYYEESVTYEEASEFLGRPLRLPEKESLYYGSPKFLIECGKSWETNRMTEKVRVTLDESAKLGFLFFVSMPREDGEEPEEWLAEGAVIEVLEVAGTTVYKAVQENYLTRYIWKDGELTYVFYQNPGEYKPLTDEECIEVIKSMIE